MGGGLEGLYRGRVSGLAAIRRDVEIATILGDGAAEIFLPFSERLFIGEGKQASNVSLPVYSEVLEDKYIKSDDQ